MNTLTDTPLEFHYGAATDLLANSSLGVELTMEQCASLSSVVRVSCLKDGQLLIAEQEVNEDIHVIIEGELGVFKVTAGGDKTLLHTLKKGDMAGELGFIDNTPHAASLYANGMTTIYSISRTDLESFIYTDSDIVYKVMRAITRTVHSILRTMNNEYIKLLNYVTHQHGRY